MRLFPLSALALALLACEHADSPPISPPPPPALSPDTRPIASFATDQGSASVRVEVVSTEAQVERGLMFREHLPPDDGMLFLLGEDKEWKFWMRNTLIPLDIIFITHGWVVAGVSANAQPRSDKLLTVGVPSLYVIEVNAGWATAHHVGPGSVVSVPGMTK